MGTSRCRFENATALVLVALRDALYTAAKGVFG